MDAIRTRPDIFVPDETYVPVKWDLSDLAEKCAFYLEHPEQRQRIVRQAYQVLSAFYTEDTFLGEVTAILARAQRVRTRLEPATRECVPRESQELI
jgi:spore maturation protein CgeB